MKFRIPNLRGVLNKAISNRDCDTQCFNKSDESYSMGRRESKNAQNENFLSADPERRGSTCPQNKSTPSCSGNDGNRDLGNAPYAFDIEKETGANQNYRTVLWTGKHLQLTVMSIPAGGETGIEMHNDLDQFVRVESGMGKVEMGRLKSNMNYTVPLDSRYAVLIPEGTYHNIINTGRTPLKLYSIYTPKAHPFGTTDVTKEDADKRETN